MQRYLARVLHVLSRVPPFSLACWCPRGCPLCSVGLAMALLSHCKCRVLFSPMFSVGQRMEDTQQTLKPYTNEHPMCCGFVAHPIILYLWYLGRATMASFFSTVSLEVTSEPLKHHGVGGCITWPHVSDTCLVNLKVLCNLIFFPHSVLLVSEVALLFHCVGSDC